MVIPYLLNHHTKSLDYFTSLCMCSGGSVSTKKMLYLSITCTTDLNLCTVCRFGVYHLSKKWKLLKMFSVLQQNLFLTTMYQITELVSLNSISCHSQCCMNLMIPVCQIPQQASNFFTITDYVSFSGNNTRSGSHHKLVQPMHGNNQSFKTLLL